MKLIKLAALLTACHACHPIYMHIRHDVVALCMNKLGCHVHDISIYSRNVWWQYHRVSGYIFKVFSLKNELFYLQSQNPAAIEQHLALRGADCVPEVCN